MRNTVNVLKRSEVKVLVMSDSASPRTVAARLLCPWSSTGKNTGVDGHSLLQRMANLGTEWESPALQANSLPSEPPAKPINVLRATKLYT